MSPATEISRGETMKSLSGRFGGVEEIKTAQTEGIRSVPSDSSANAYLELYMLLKKKERLERRNDERQLQAVLARIKKLQESLPPQLEEVKPAREEQVEIPKKKGWKVMSIDY
jgi:hypothetical protein